MTRFTPATAAAALVLSLAMPLAAVAQTAAPSAPADTAPAPAAPAAAPAATAPAAAAAPAGGTATIATVGAATAGDITITDAYARSSNPKVGAAFMTIANAGTADCVLGAATSEVAQTTELHTHRDEGGVMKMVKVDSITIPAGGTHALQRGADHIMLIDTPQPLAEGQEVALTLDFGTCGTVPLVVKVDNQAGAPMGMGAGMGAGMGGMGGHAHGHGMGHGMGAGMGGMGGMAGSAGPSN